MRDIQKLVDGWIQAGQGRKQVEATRREIAKYRNEIATRALMQARGGRPTHPHRMRYPTRDKTFVLEEERKVRDLRLVENPMLTQRRKQFDPKVQQRRSR